MVTKLGRGALMAKFDVRSAFRNLAVLPSQRYLLGMKWRGKFFVDLVLPFGLRSAPFIFNSVAEMVEWILRHNYSIRDLLHYLDDYITAGPPECLDCARNIALASSVCQRLGLPLHPDKTVGPSTRLTVLGIELDTILQIARLPPTKLQDLKLLLRDWSSRKWCTRIQLESLIGKLHLGTWYRPPSSPGHSITLFEKIIDRIDAENSELFLLGDLNCNLFSNAPNSNTSELLNIFEIYNLSQTITEATRITNTSQTLIDLCITNNSDVVKSSGVFSICISDHSLVYLIRKTTHYKTSVTALIEKRNFKNFNEHAYLNDLNNLNWGEVCTHYDPNLMWTEWLNLVMSVINKHAPLKKKRIGKRRSPWITPQVVQKIRIRDYLKQRFDGTRDNNTWVQYKKARNEANNIIKRAKQNYFYEYHDCAERP